MKFYHGTTDKFHIKKLKPAIITGNLREEWRKKHQDKVFLTDSVYSAKKFAHKATEKYGGKAVVYEVEPNGPIFKTITNEYITDEANIIKLVAKYDDKWKEVN